MGAMNEMKKYSNCINKSVSEHNQHSSLGLGSISAKPMPSRKLR
jgi:hypothetical protein